jgi:hypothetical protein
MVKTKCKTLDQHELEKLRDEQLSGLEVKDSTVTEWLKATVGAHMPRRVKGEKVVKLKGVPSSKWGVL